MISCGSMVQLSFKKLWMFDPAAPSEGTPAVAAVASISLASRPFSARLAFLKVRLQERAEISTLLVRHTMVSAVMEIFLLAGKRKLVSPANSRASAFLSHPFSSGEYGATTAASASALFPVTVTGAAEAARGNRTTARNA